MIALYRDGEVVIEDGYLRVVVLPDGGGYVHAGHEVNEVDLHYPLYLIAARQAGLPLSDELIALASQDAS